jgi:non-specific serine/threonine protein kinase
LHAKKLLLVLDNCEHLLEGAAALAETLARSCERLVILATSREGLGIEGRALLPVPPAGVPGGRRRPGGDHAGGGGAAVR